MIRVGQKLYSVRVNKSLSLDEIASATKIRPNFLQAIERGEYDKLPSPTYAQGFIRNYARYLGLSEKDILPLFRREFPEKNNIKVLPDSLANTERSLFSNILNRQSAMVFVFGFITLAAYIGFQYRSVFIAPSLYVETPKSNEKINNEIMVTGRADPNATVIVNNEEVSLNPHGEFNKTLTLFPGENSISVKATNRFGKESLVERNVVVEE